MGMVQLHFTQDEVWLMPIGQLLDLIACHQQYMGREKPKRDLSLDEILPIGI